MRLALDSPADPERANRKIRIKVAAMHLFKLSPENAGAAVANRRNFINCCLDPDAAGHGTKLLGLLQKTAP
jgi:hypothetical protein